MLLLPQAGSGAPYAHDVAFCKHQLCSIQCKFATVFTCRDDEMVVDDFQEIEALAELGVSAGAVHAMLEAAAYAKQADSVQQCKVCLAWKEQG
jgi:hypothetical protein